MQPISNIAAERAKRQNRRPIVDRKARSTANTAWLMAAAALILAVTSLAVSVTVVELAKVQ